MGCSKVGALQGCIKGAVGWEHAGDLDWDALNAIRYLWSCRAVSCVIGHQTKWINIGMLCSALSKALRQARNRPPSSLAVLLHPFLSVPLGFPVSHWLGWDGKWSLLEVPAVGPGCWLRLHPALLAHGHALISAGVCNADTGAQCVPGAAPGAGRGDLRAESRAQ